MERKGSISAVERGTAIVRVSTDALEAFESINVESPTQFHPKCIRESTDLSTTRGETHRSEDNKQSAKAQVEIAPKGSQSDFNMKGIMFQLTAEMIGTFVIVIFGVGSVVTAVTTGAQRGIWQVAVVWGFGVTLAILVSAEISGAHLNPAVSLAFLLVRPVQSFDKNFWIASLKCFLYMIAQCIGGILGGIVNLGIYGETIASFERANNIIRGEAGSERSAMVFGEYFPNPGFKDTPVRTSDVSPIQACAIEAWGTCVLCFVIFTITHPKNPILGKESRPMAPYFIGFTVAALISLYAPQTQAGWNPARDFGPRIVAAFAGWGRIAIPGPRNGFWVYIAGPMIGGPIGAFLGENYMNLRKYKSK